MMPSSVNNHPPRGGIMAPESVRQTVTFEVVPHPRSRGDWFLKPTWGAPFGLWYRDRQFAINYAEWLAREVQTAEIRVYNRDGSLAGNRVISKAGQPEESI
jgi:hypothetical protein